MDTMNRRPFLTVRPYTWRAPDGTRTAGVALKRGGLIRAHMTPDEARVMADKLHDIADQTEQEVTK